MRDYPLIHELVEHFAAKTPDAIALEHKGAAISYRQLDQSANAFAQLLVSYNVEPEAIIAVDAHRTPATLIAMLGIWKAGAAYLPLDPALPSARREGMLQDACPSHVVTTDSHPAFSCLAPPSVQSAPSAFEAPMTSLAQNQLAYVLFTSGSTGTPKGVLVEHHGLAHRAHVQTRQFDVKPTERCTQYSNLAWDASLFEITLAWGAGATLTLIPDAIRRSGTALAQFLETAGAHIAFFPPSVLATIPSKPLPNLRMVMVGGDVFPDALVQRWGGARRFANLYGPTETTVWTSTDNCIPGKPANLGHPIDGVEMMVQDPEGNPLPQGDIGELCIGGLGVARGYLGRPELTASRFVSSTTNEESRIYRTGDRARILADGSIEMHGRMDGQVKIRGMRVELGDIEAAVGNAPGVQSCAAATDTDARGNKRLVAYVHLENSVEGPARFASAETVRALRTALQQTLPEALLPSQFIELAPLPLTANGKLDRAALPPLPQEPHAVSLTQAPPRSKTEQLLTDLWNQELGTRPGLHENVFELGAHSLLAARVQEALERHLGRTLDIIHVFEHPTVAGLAKHIDQITSPLPRVVPSTTAAQVRGQARRAARAPARRPRPNPEDSQ